MCTSSFIGFLTGIIFMIAIKAARKRRVVSEILPFVLDYMRFRSFRNDEFPIKRIFPCLEDKRDEGGTAKGDYFNQDLLVARRIFENRPNRHIDVGSRIDGFVAHVAAFREIEVVDIRPLSVKVKNISFVQTDFSAELDAGLKGKYDSVSSLHAIEHFGLGRYGDPIGPDAWKSGVNNLKMMVASRGRLYFSVPIGPQRIEFNAHRVFSIKTVIGVFENEFELVHFSYVDDRGELHENVEMTDDGMANNFGCSYGCGIFEFIKMS